MVSRLLLEKISTGAPMLVGDNKQKQKKMFARALRPPPVQSLKPVHAYAEYY